MLKLLVPVIITLGILSVMSVFALTKLPSGSLIPMQWNFHGNPTWYAPSNVGVWFAPGVAFFVLGIFAYTITWNPGNGILPKVTVLTALIFLAVHAAHLFFALKQFKM